jgi:parallel beta-helix repeat protein
MLAVDLAAGMSERRSLRRYELRFFVVRECIAPPGDDRVSTKGEDAKMFQLALTALTRSHGHRETALRADSGRRRRDRWSPDAELLEGRDCPSGLTPHLGYAESAHALVAGHPAATDHKHHGIPAKRAKAGGPQTIFVAPKGKLGFTAGRNAAHPLGSLTLALKRAKPGTTIILAPGVYTQSAGMTGKTDITIQGAAGNESILAGSGGYAMKVNSSTGITIESVWFRPPNGGGLAVVGSSVTLQNVETDGSYGDGVVVAGGGSVNVISSHFDKSQTGDGMDVQAGTATISGSTFSDNGPAGGSQGGPGSGLSVEGNSQVNITNSQFIGNLNANLVAFGQAQVTAQGSLFSQSQQGDGALFAGSGAVNLTGNTFTLNSTVRGFIPGVGFDGVEFFHTFTGTAIVSGNTFSDNTAHGVYIGGSSSPIQILNNTFDNNAVGLSLDASVAPLSAVVEGNTFTVSAGSTDQGVYADGSGATATIGGTGAQENSFQNYASGNAIVQNNLNGQPVVPVGYPNLTILGNIGA